MEPRFSGVFLFWGKALQSGALDVAVRKLPEVPGGAELLRAERLLWMASRFHDPATQDPLPVALFDRACWRRDAALDDLAASGRRHHTVFSSESTVGVRAATASGIAVGMPSEPLQGDDLVPVPNAPRPRLSHLVLELAPDATGPACEAICAAMRDAFGCR